MFPISFSTSKYFILCVCGEKEDLLLAASKENTRDLFQSSVSLNSKTGEVLSQGSLMFMKGLDQRLLPGIGIKVAKAEALDD